MAKMGRPTMDDPKTHIIACKVNDKELSLLEKYCKENKISKSTILRNGIKHIIFNGRNDL